MESQFNLASAALRFGELDTARKALEQVARKIATKQPTMWWPAGWRMPREMMPARKNISPPRSNRIRLTIFTNSIWRCCKSSRRTRPSRDKARQTLQRLSKVLQFRVGALRALLNDAVKQKDLEAAGDLAQDLQMSPQVTFADYLLCLDFYRKLNENKFSALLNKVKPVAARDPPISAALMDWMNSNGLAGEVLKWTEKLKPETTADPPASIAVAEAFASVKNWSRLKRWTRNGSWGDADYLRLAYQAFAARQSRQHGGEAEFQSLWRSAETAAREDAERELNLARLATKWKLG